MTTSTLASSIGSEVSGQVLSYLLETKGWKPVDAYHSLFWIYAVMGLLSIALVWSSTKLIEGRPESVYSGYGSQRQSRVTLASTSSGECGE